MAPLRYAPGAAPRRFLGGAPTGGFGGGAPPVGRRPWSLALRYAPRTSLPCSPTHSASLRGGPRRRRAGRKRPARDPAPLNPPPASRPASRLVPRRLCGRAFRPGNTVTEHSVPSPKGQREPDVNATRREPETHRLHSPIGSLSYILLT